MHTVLKTQTHTKASFGHERTGPGRTVTVEGSYLSCGTQQAGQQEGHEQGLEVRSQETPLKVRKGCLTGIRPWQPILSYDFVSFLDEGPQSCLLHSKATFLFLGGKTCYAMYFPILGLFPGLYFQ